MTLRVFAPAKINLFLHVGPPAADGYHPLCSWMVFADVGDWVTVGPGATGFTIDGPFADGVPTDAGNLVLKAQEAIAPNAAFALHLEKNLPPSSGIGGGSSDAAAALRGIAAAVGGQHDLAAMALRLGSDVSPCLAGRSLIARGRGEVLSEAPFVPVLHAVLVNPRVEVSTGQIFRTYDSGPAGGDDTPAMPAAIAELERLIALLRTTRNDLEAPAIALAPQIATVIGRLQSAPESRFVRMSGSGATVFALCEEEAGASTLAARLAAEEPGWWVRACRLGGPWPDDLQV